MAHPLDVAERHREGSISYKRRQKTCLGSGCIFTSLLTLRIATLEKPTILHNTGSILIESNLRPDDQA